MCSFLSDLGTLCVERWHRRKLGGHLSVESYKETNDVKVVQLRALRLPPVVAAAKDAGARVSE